jgi:hypothetical protein
MPKNRPADGGGEDAISCAIEESRPPCPEKLYAALGPLLPGSRSARGFQRSPPAPAPNSTPAMPSSSSLRMDDDKRLSVP